MPDISELPHISPASRAPRLCVLIDADNVPAGYAEAIFEEIASLGEASVRRIYGDWSAQRLAGWAKRVAELGLVADQQFANTKGKNASDIGLVIAAMDFLHSDLFDGFVLVSSDSDFTRLAARIREQGLDVYGIGEQKTPEAFRKACKRFIYVENLGNGDSTTDTTAKPTSDKTSSSSAPKSSGGKQEPKAAIPIIVNAMKAIGLEEEWYSLGQLGQFITQANPDFDTRTYGSAKLSDLLIKTGRFQLQRGEGNQWMVRDLA
ncbi:NYN domain-containing protein [Thioclava electrotropha]|uniref:NYN domain-containing protein n=1 Tax=Thioclava electrotropha TaxID=1549850 RepID=A0ABX6YVK6_9RHOB|nr:NYN domain-containing protein [Thioclava electrotropha]QPZ91886.1 NYN domain-containing protein [Thioclava electrotropha]